MYRYRSGTVHVCVPATPGDNVPVKSHGGSQNYCNVPVQRHRGEPGHETDTPARQDPGTHASPQTHKGQTAPLTRSSSVVVTVVATAPSNTDYGTLSHSLYNQGADQRPTRCEYTSIQTLPPNPNPNRLCTGALSARETPKFGQSCKTRYFRRQQIIFLTT